MTLRLRTAILFALLVVFPAGCSKPKSPQGSLQSSRGAAAMAIDPANTGAISGTIRFDGTAPARVPIDMDQDPACAISKVPNLSEGIVVNQGKLRNVFIYVKRGLEDYAMAKPSAPAVLDQKGCRYVPHVLGMVAGQTLRVLNSDAAEHNVHPMPRNNAEWNESQMPGGAPKEHVLDHAELMLPITCNQHPWMKLYVNVVKNLFFAVSDCKG